MYSHRVLMINGAAEVFFKMKLKEFRCNYIGSLLQYENVVSDCCNVGLVIDEVLISIDGDVNFSKSRVTYSCSKSDYICKITPTIPKIPTVNSIDQVKNTHCNSFKFYYIHAHAVSIQIWLGLLRCSAQYVVTGN